MATAIILDSLNNKTKTINSKGYPVTKIKPSTRYVRIDDILPFRVKFTNIAIESISTNPPPIPLQVIGYSNYIL